MKGRAILAVLLKSVVPLVAGLVVLVVVIFWLAGGFEEKIEPGRRQSAVEPLTELDENRIDEVHEESKEYFAEAIGTLKAASRTEVSSRILAPIEKLFVKAGDPVKRGDPLVELDGRALDTQISRAQASLVAAQAAVTQAENDYKRDLGLYNKGMIPQGQMEQTTANLRVARAELGVAQQALEEAKVMRSYTTIKAPKAGMIVDTLAEVGDTARPGVPLLVLYDPTSLRLEVPVMENLVERLREIQEQNRKLTVHIDALNRDVEALIDEIVPQAEAASRSFLVKVRLPRSEGLFEGMAGRLLIPAGKRRHLCLATAAIERIGQLQFVEVADLQNGTKQRRLIKTGRLGMPGRVEVLSGLKAGEKVVLKRPSPGHEEPTSDTAAGSQHDG